MIQDKYMKGLTSVATRALISKYTCGMTDFEMPESKCNCSFSLSEIGSSST